MNKTKLKKSIVAFFLVLLLVCSTGLSVTASTALPEVIMSVSSVIVDDSSTSNEENNVDSSLPEDFTSPTPQEESSSDASQVDSSIVDSSVQEETPDSSVIEEEPEEVLPDPELEVEHLEFNIVQGFVLQGDSYYTAADLAKAGRMVMGNTDVTDQFDVVISDMGGYDENTPGTYYVTFEATNKTDSSLTYTETGKYVVLTIDELVALCNNEEDSQSVFANASAFSIDGDVATLELNGESAQVLSLSVGVNGAENDWEPVSEYGLSVSATTCTFYGYRFAQAIPLSSFVHMYSGAANLFYSYHLYTTDGDGVPLYCVEPNMQDKAPDGSWVGGIGYVYEFIATGADTTGNFHEYVGSWALSTDKAKTIASAVAYFSRPYADASSDWTVSDTWYVAAQVLIWEAITGVLDVDSKSSNFMEYVPETYYYDRDAEEYKTGYYRDYQYSLYQACILGNNYPEYNANILDAYESLKTMIKNYYAIPDFMVPDPAQAVVGAYELPHPSTGESIKLYDDAAVLATIDWTAIENSASVSVDTSHISSGYVEVKANSVIDQSTPATVKYTKNYTSTGQDAYFLSPYGNKALYNGGDTGQTKMAVKTIDPAYGYISFYTGEEPNGTLALTKTSEDGIVSGLQFRVVSSDGGTVNETFTTDATGKISEELLAGTYTVTEISTPSRYVQPASQTVTITAGETSTVSFNNVLKKWRVTVTKVDSDLTTAQGSASLQGAVYGIYNSSGTLQGRYTTNASGSFTSDYFVCGEGYYLQEITPSPGYTLDTTKYALSGSAGSHTVELNTTTQTATEVVIRGGVYWEKWDIELDTNTAQGDATLAGAKADIYNRNTNSVVVNGTTYAPGEVVYTMTTSANGTAQSASNLLPAGDYELVETVAPDGYLNTGAISRTFSITENGVIVQLSTSSTAIKNNVIRGGVYIEKWDNETDANTAQGGATFENTVIDVYNRSAAAVIVNGITYQPNAVVVTLYTDAAGAVVTDDDLLPYGAYEAIERTPPAGYLATGVLKQSFSITDNGVIVELNTSDTAIKNNPKRGDLEFVKVSDGDMARLSNIPFSITSVTTGESHIIVTDDNAQASTASSWNPHSQYTNRGETSEDGVWFGDIAQLDDSKGGLLYDYYLLEELPCANNANYTLLPPILVRIYRDSTTVNLGTLTNDYTTVPEIGTTAKDSQTGANYAYVGGSTTIIDTVAYTGLQTGVQYTVNGVLMDKATDEPLLVNGEQVTASKTFTATSADGTVDIEFTFDSSALQGQSVVVFESLYIGVVEVATHADITDEGQTITFVEPEIGTTAIDADTGTHTAQVSPTTTIVDTVSYTGLKPGEEYTVSGVIMSKTTGEPLVINGEQVTASETFVPTTSNGSVDISFTFDSTALQGETIVVFEALYLNGVEIAIHADISDTRQTITFEVPEIGTTAIDADTGSHTAQVSPTTTIVDTVSYTGLKPGEEYTVSGVIMSKTTGEPLVVNGEQVTASKTFVPTTSTGSVELSFTFDSTALEGQSVVVYETVELNGVEIAVHADIDDVGQTVTFERKIEGDVQLHKVNTSGEALAGVNFDLYQLVNGSWALQGSYTTDDTGYIKVHLPAGDYKFIETATLTGYVLDATEHTFSIQELDVVVPLTVVNSPEGTVDTPTYGQLVLTPDTKRFPKTGVKYSDTETITETYELESDTDTAPAISDTIEKDGQTYRLVDVAYQLVAEPIQTTVTLEDLTEQTVPQTYTYENEDGSQVELSFLSVTYAEIANTQPYTVTVDYGYSAGQPAVDQTFTVTTDADGNELPAAATLTLESVTSTGNYGWQSFTVPAVFYGDSSISGFYLGDTLIPYSSSAPTWQGYEQAYLNYLGYSSSN